MPSTSRCLECFGLHATDAHPTASRRFCDPTLALQGNCLDTRTEVLRILDEVMSLGGRAQKFQAETPLMGAIPEFDSMVVVSLITTLEERFGIAVDDDEISGDTFVTVGSLTDFITGKLSA